MEFCIKYPELEGQIASRGIKKGIIAKRIGCSYRAFRNKCAGKSNFTWDEVNIMRAEFFPDMATEALMRTNTKEG